MANDTASESDKSSAVTDDQIRALRSDLADSNLLGFFAERLHGWLVCDLALQIPPTLKDSRRPTRVQIAEVRARCADILNARAVSL